MLRKHRICDAEFFGKRVHDGFRKEADVFLKDRKSMRLVKDLVKGKCDNVSVGGWSLGG